MNKQTIPQQLFTGRAFEMPGFFPPKLCQKWAEVILGNKDVFASDVEPEYGQCAAYYGMIESGLNESYYRFAEKHNAFMDAQLPEYNLLGAAIGEMILKFSDLPINSLPIVPRDKKYFLKGGFNIQLRNWDTYNVHTDSEGLIMYPASIFDPATRPYSAVISIKRTANWTPKKRGGDIEIWEERLLCDELDDFYGPDGYTPVDYSKSKIFDYTEGNLVIFDSFCPHAVLPFKVKKDEDIRITFVLHFNYSEGTKVNPFPHLEYWF